MGKLVEIINSHKMFPCKIPKNEGEYLIKIFEFSKHCLNNQEEARTITYVYKYEFEGEKYVLMEEFLFSDMVEMVDVSHAIDKNYYLNKKEKE